MIQVLLPDENTRKIQRYAHKRYVGSDNIGVDLILQQREQRRVRTCGWEFAARPDVP
jgi:hypothetical protein